MYEFAYSEICEELPSRITPKPRRLPDAIELIEAAEGVSSSSHEFLEVLSDFRRLWLTIVEDFSLRSASGQYSINIIPLADGVLHEIERCRFYRAETDAAVNIRRGRNPL